MLLFVVTNITNNFSHRKSNKDNITLLSKEFSFVAGHNKRLLVKLADSR